MTFTRKINTIIDEALISKKEIKADPQMIKTLTDSFDLNKYKGVRKNILRPLFKKIAETYNVNLNNNGKTIIFDFNSLNIEKDTTSSRQLSVLEKTILSNLLFRYNYVFDENLFLVGNAKKRNGHLESLINIFDKIRETIKDYQKHQNEKDRNTIKIKKLEDDLKKIKTDKKFLSKTETEKEKIKLSKEDALKKLEEKNIILKETLENLQKDEEAFTKLQDKIYKYKDINYKILITYIPWRVAAMSTFSSSDAPWSSCMNLEKGVNRHYVGSSISNGAFVAYLIRPGDEQNIENPIARVLIKPFLRIENDDYINNYNYEYDDEDFDENELDAFQYAEIDYIDKDKLDTDVFWYVDLVYPRGQYGEFRSKVVGIFNKINANVESGRFVITKGQYADSQEIISIDDVFKYINAGNYSDITTKSNSFISQMLQKYPFEFFSNWPENTPMPVGFTINADITLENMDIRRLPDGLNINGNLYINNLNIRKINKVKCKRLVLTNNNNLESIDNCELNTLHLNNNKKLSNIIRNNKYKELEIINCKKIDSLDNLTLKSLKIIKKEKTENFSFGKNLKIEEEIELNNFKIEDYSFFKNIKTIILKKIEMDSLSGNYEKVFIDSESKIETIENLNAMYALEIGNHSVIKNFINVKIDSTFSLDNDHIEVIKNLKMTQSYQSPVSRYVGCLIACKNLKEITNVSAEHFLSIYQLKDIKIINNLSCDSDISFKECDFNNFNNLANFKIKCKKLIFERSKIKTIKNFQIEQLNIIESEVNEISDIDCEKELEINKSINIKTLKNIKAKERIYINMTNIENIFDIKTKIIYFNKNNIGGIVDFNNNEIEKINIYASSLKEIKNVVVGELIGVDYGYIDKIENFNVKGDLKIFGTNTTEIGKNVVFGIENKSTRYRINFIDSTKISRDFKILGDALWFNNEIEILPFMTVKGTLNVYSDNIKDVTEGAEIDKLNIFGDKKMFRDDLDKEKLLSKIKTLKT